MSDDLVQMLDNFIHAYPVEVFPVPPKEEQAINSAAAHVMREVALPVFEQCRDRITELETAIRTHRQGVLDSGGDIRKQYHIDRRLWELGDQS